LTDVSEFEIVTSIRLIKIALASEFTMNHADIVQLIFGIFLCLLLGLVAANFAVIVASLSRHEEIAKSITGFLSNYLWLLRMGGDGDPANRNSRKHA
jgi:hypothetical protein